MAGSLIDIKKRISSTKKTSQITSAMQMVAVSKLSKSEQASKTFQEYARKVKNMTIHLVASQLHDKINFSNVPNKNSKMLIPREVKKTAYIIITSDKGLAGGYNQTVIKEMELLLAEKHKKQSDYALIPLGSHGADYFQSHHYPIEYEQRQINDFPSPHEIQHIVNKVIHLYNNEIFDELYLCYNHHVNMLTSTFRAEKILPIVDLEVGHSDTFEQPYILEPSATVILDSLLPLYTESIIHGALLDAKTAEHASRMTAMKNATDNATSLIDELTIEYNRARQSAITEQITEIVSGASALEDN